MTLKRIDEGYSTPPPLLKGGEGVRGREGTLGIKPKKEKHPITPHFPIPLHSETSECHLLSP